MRRITVVGGALLFLSLSLSLSQMGLEDGRAHAGEPARAAKEPRSIAPAWSPREKQAANNVSASTMRSHVSFLSDDLLEGRGPGSRGDALAARYVTAELARLGLEPLETVANKGTHVTGYEQRFDIVGMTTTVSSAPVVTGRLGKIQLKPGVDSIFAPGRQVETARLGDGKGQGPEIVFVGYGITAPEQGWDDYKDVDVRGKVLLMMNNDPAEDPKLFGGKARLYYGRWSYKFEEAARRGAVGAIIIHTTPSAGYPWQVVQTSWAREQFELPQGSEPRIDLKMWATDELSHSLTALGGQDLDLLRDKAERTDFRPVPLGVRLSVGVTTRLRKLESTNVGGLLRGTDDKLAKEYVIYTAHHDHLGVGDAKGGDAIYNGALDNAAGLAQMLAIAEGMVHAGKPRRSVIFLSVGAEESGLIGSEYFCRTAPFPQ